MNITRLPWHALAALLAGVTLAACGGVDSGGTGQTVQATTSEGRISGFGSVIVNGVRFDDDRATVVDDDGNARSRADLKLGMVVEVQGDLQGSSGTGVAHRIQYGNEIAGPVQSVNAAGSQLVVLGQVVKVDSETIFSGYASGLAGVVAGDLVEVSAFFDPTTSVYAATRIERKTALASYKLRGRLSSLAGLPIKTFLIGGALVDYGSIAAGLLPTLANGLSVRVSLQPTLISGLWIASSVRTSQRNLPDATDAELEGYVSSFVDSGHFIVAGIQVDASGPGVRVKHGVIGDLANGVRVEVEGQVRNGVLVASDLDFKHGGDQEFELHGAIESVNPAAKTLVLRGVTVGWDDSTTFAGGSVSNLVVGAQIEVRGEPTPNGSLILARKVKFEK